MTIIVIGLGALAVVQVLRYIGQRNKYHHHYTRLSGHPRVSETDIVLHGNNSGISTEQIQRILQKRFPYYQGLNEEQQRKFLKRIERFLHSKIFIIKDDEGFKEMPVLISAAAIQLTFGLAHYRLPFYRYIRIYPEEYFSGDSLKILAGNVQGNVITVAWNHLLKGLDNPADGANVGLHEMSHALYFQKLIIEKNFSFGFIDKYNHLLSECRTAFDDALKGHIDLYSDYATKDLQEFWAESVELFFEKPAALNQHYPAVYLKMTDLLNQNPLNRANPVMKTSFLLRH